MNKKTPQDYANELLALYRENAKELNQFEAPSSKSDTSAYLPFEDGTGGIVVNVTTLNRLYPVKDALVTIFTGSGDNIRVVETGLTDQSGKSDVFNVMTPPRADSQQAENGGENPYSKYNISVKSDGYVEQIAMNVPVFSGVISVQNIDLLPIASAGNNTKPQIINEDNNYNL